MARIVMKFGGTSMAGTERIRRVAQIVRKQAAARDGGRNEVAVVVSAMAGETDRLVNFAREAHALYDPAEYDVVVASGEQVTSGLLALTLQSLGTKARSWLGWQLPIRTVEAHAKARVDAIDGDALLASMAEGTIAVIPGFQGLSAEGRVTTMGRGGSDTSAVAVAAAVKADRCDIYTDVDGVYTTDPRIVAKARKLKAVTYEEMLELASVGAKVLQTRSVSLAMKEGVRIQVLSSFVDDNATPADDLPGTLIVSEDEMERMVEEGLMERKLVTGIAHDKNEAKIILTRVPDKPGAVAEIFGPLAEASINVDMIIQNVGRDKGETDVTFTIPQTDLARAQALLEDKRESIGYNRIITDSHIAKISVVGVGMKSHAGVASDMFRALADRGINIQAITTSEIKVSVMIDEDETELAVRVLHTAYGLDAEDAA
ncbi:aspartate kinase [Alteriqipengyuania lutimaris]|uniref:Aspartokinase n=1 Tax=Alteriqipengyuania lutimaris TaxID=1538146 RepID=A0A395LJI4_9SPHN|nr:aspartate kinase [Alteriqipengyuania lutimaris]MBB3034661.1 aspartate kinase [Alteriqipengyuania lutimaris]RDS76477.1 aspartate kinase [Alteriqipengyuania lutimaris]